MSAHRTLSKLQIFLKCSVKWFWSDNCAAGKAAHLGGVLASQTIIPIIGLPIKSSTLDGLDALLSTVQMPKCSSCDGSN